MTERHPKISVITVCYNAVNTIKNTILSVLNQTYNNIEYIIIDGNSTDGTLDIIREYSERIAYIVSEPDRGIYDAMNKGIKIATGEWINFMNAGDEFCSNDVLNRVFFDIDLNADVLYGNIICKYDFGMVLQKPLPLNELSAHMIFCHQASFVRAALMKEEFFDIKFKIAADYNFFYKLYKGKRNFLYIDENIAVYEAENGASSISEHRNLLEYQKINGLIPYFQRGWWRQYYHSMLKCVLSKDTYNNYVRRKLISKETNQHYE